jgi:hypothetical protein
VVVWCFWDSPAESLGVGRSPGSLYRRAGTFLKINVSSEIQLAEELDLVGEDSEVHSSEFLSDCCAFLFEHGVSFIDLRKHLIKLI